MGHHICGENKQEETNDTSSSPVESGTVIVTREDESSKSENDSLGTELNGGEQKADAVAADSVVEVIDIESTGDTGSGESINREKICRICHLSSENLSRNSSFMKLGCSCKHELGISHKHCATAWFGSKGNRLCEICGEAAKNVVDGDETKVAVELREIRFIAGGWSNAESEVSRRRKRCCRHSIFAALVLAFILPWIFLRHD